MRIAVTGGKTGGHVFPALAVGESLRRLLSTPNPSEGQPEEPATTAELLYVGLAGGIEQAAVPTARIPLLTLRIATPDRPARIARSMLDLFLATLTCLQRFRRFKPQVVFSTGGFVSIPAMLAAWVTRTPVILFLPDVLPGRTVRVFSRIARRIAVSSSDSVAYLPSNGKTVVTGYPVRDEFTAILRTDARRDAGLAETDLQLLVMGGSLGAAAINRAIAAGLLELLPLARIVHICGRAHIAEMATIRDSLSEEQRDRYRLNDYLDSEAMATVLVASDLAITRGGASIMGELPATGVPAIVVPFPAAQVGQEANARALARAGGCEVISNESAAAGALVDKAKQLLSDTERRHDMAHAMKSLGRTNPADAIASLVIQGARPS